MATELLRENLIKFLIGGLDMTTMYIIIGTRNCENTFGLCAILYLKENCQSFSTCWKCWNKIQGCPHTHSNADKGFFS
jgi:hypothetical protein